MHLDMVRAGIMIYGLYPSDEVIKGNVKIEPILSFKTTVAHVKEVDAGASISYVRTYKTSKRTKIATLPVGYADGYNRLLSNKGEVLIRGKRYPIVGNVCMDMCMAEIGDEIIETGDEVVLIGRQGNETITIEEIAKKTGTINYEVQCAINKRVPRVYLKDNKIIEVVKRVGG
jgi:alanine racemase